LHFLYRKEAEDALTQGKINGPLMKDGLNLITTGEELNNLKQWLIFKLLSLQLDSTKPSHLLFFHSRKTLLLVTIIG
jgi:hypothetical protein